MTTADWGILIPAVIAFLTAGTAWLKGHTAQQTATRAEAKADRALNGMAKPGGPEAGPPGP